MAESQTKRKRAHEVISRSAIPIPHFDDHTLVAILVRQVDDERFIPDRIQSRAQCFRLELHARFFIERC